MIQSSAALGMWPAASLLITIYYIILLQEALALKCRSDRDERTIEQFEDIVRSCLRVDEFDRRGNGVDYNKRNSDRGNRFGGSDESFNSDGYDSNDYGSTYNSYNQGGHRERGSSRNGSEDSERRRSQGGRSPSTPGVKGGGGVGIQHGSGSRDGGITKGSNPAVPPAQNGTSKINKNDNKPGSNDYYDDDDDDEDYEYNNDEGSEGGSKDGKQGKKQQNRNKSGGKKSDSDGQGDEWGRDNSSRGGQSVGSNSEMNGDRSDRNQSARREQAYVRPDNDRYSGSSNQGGNRYNDQDQEGYGGSYGGSRGSSRYDSQRQAAYMGGSNEGRVGSRYYNQDQDSYGANRGGNRGDKNYNSPGQEGFPRNQHGIRGGISYSNPRQDGNGNAGSNRGGNMDSYIGQGRTMSNMGSSFGGSSGSQYNPMRPLSSPTSQYSGSRGYGTSYEPNDRYGGRDGIYPGPSGHTGRDDGMFHNNPQMDPRRYSSIPEQQHYQSYSGYPRTSNQFGLPGFSNSTKKANSPLQNVEPCTLLCVFRQMKMVDKDSYLNRQIAMTSMMRRPKNGELRDFLGHAVSKCFDIHQLETKERCDGAKIFALCMEDLGKMNCEDWELPPTFRPGQHKFGQTGQSGQTMSRPQLPGRG